MLLVGNGRAACGCGFMKKCLILSNLQNKYIFNHSLNIEAFLGVMDFGQEFFVSASVCDSRTGILGRIWLGSSAAFGGRLQRPSPCRVRSAHRRQRGRAPSETSECRGGISEKLLHLHGCNAWMIYKIGIISKRYLIMFEILRWHTLER